MLKVRMNRLEQFYILKSCVFKTKKKRKKMLFPNRNNKPLVANQYKHRKEIKYKTAS